MRLSSMQFDVQCSQNDWRPSPALCLTDAKLAQRAEIIAVRNPLQGDAELTIPGVVSSTSRTFEDVAACTDKEHVMTTMEMESTAACALQLRKLLNMGPKEGDHGAANLAETMVTKLTARVPSGTNEITAAKRLIVDLRGFFLSPRPFSHQTVVRNRDHLSRRIKLLHEAVARYE